MTHFPFSLTNSPFNLRLLQWTNLFQVKNTTTSTPQISLATEISYIMHLKCIWAIRDHHDPTANLVAAILAHFVYRII